MSLEVNEVCAWFHRGQDPSPSVCLPDIGIPRIIPDFSPPFFYSSLQEWTYTYNHQVRQQQLCLSVYTLFPGSQVLLSPCKEGDNKQVSLFFDTPFSSKFSFFQHNIESLNCWCALTSSGKHSLSRSTDPGLLNETLCLLNECVGKDVY